MPPHRIRSPQAVSIRSRVPPKMPLLRLRAIPSASASRSLTSRPLIAPLTIRRLRRGTRNLGILQRARSLTPAPRRSLTSLKYKDSPSTSCSRVKSTRATTASSRSPYQAGRVGPRRATRGNVRGQVLLILAKPPSFKATRTVRSTSPPELALPGMVFSAQTCLISLLSPRAKTKTARPSTSILGAFASRWTTPRPRILARILLQMQPSTTPTIRTRVS